MSKVDYPRLSEKIAQDEQTISELIPKNKEISKLERDGTILSQQHASRLLEMETLKNQLIAMQAALDAEKANTASAPAQLAS